MTAEITIMNKEAIALAADSAVTMSVGETSQKIFTSANKLFALSKYHPVGVMIYGNAALMNVPWETIIKIYRSRLGRRRMPTLDEYADDFIAFLDRENPLFPDSVQLQYLRESVYAYFEFLKDTIRSKVHAVIDDAGEITDEEIKHIVGTIIEEHHQKWNGTNNIPSMKGSFVKNLIRKHGKIIDEAINEVFEELGISRKHRNQLRRIGADLFSKFPEHIRNEDVSGVVIAGFGESDIFPSLKSFDMEGVIENRLKYRERTSAKIDHGTSAYIEPFAQQEMVVTFMEGVDPRYREAEQSYLSQIFGALVEMLVDKVEKYTDQEKATLRHEMNALGEKILEKYDEGLKGYRNDRYTSPILAVVSMLPKDELAAMAESLVNLTSFKRKVTTESETVAGPIDVAVISKGDGFIWIKRKHYFKPELNPQFFANYYREERNGQD